MLLAATACGAAMTPAIEVNADEVSRSDLLDEAAALAGPLGAGTSTTASTEFMGQLIVIHINELLLYQEAEALGVEITEDHVVAATELLEASNNAQLEDADDQAILNEILAPLVAAQIALEGTVDPNQVLTEGYSTAVISVDPRFGTWDADSAQVIPPEGPVPG
jgi:hypothetical protein